MNETIRTLTERASCRKFRPEHISQEELDLVLAAGLGAPSGMNLQPQHFVVVRSEETIRKLSRLNGAVVGNTSGDPFYGAPDLVLVLVEKTATCVEDGSLALGNMLNAAYSLGLGACWIHRAHLMFETEEGKAFLREWGLSEDLIGVGCCILGYPAAELTTREKTPGRITYVD